MMDGRSIFPESMIDRMNERLKKSIELSTCNKRRIASALVLDDGYTIIDGWNGPSYRGWGLDYCNPCPRGDARSGQKMEVCPGIHAEVCPIIQAAFMGYRTEGSTLVITCGLPCKDCMKEIIMAGVKMIVSPFPLDYVIRPDGLQANAIHYNFPLSRQMMEKSDVEYIHEPRLVNGR